MALFRERPSAHGSVSSLPQYLSCLPTSRHIFGLADDKTGPVRVLEVAGELTGVERFRKLWAVTVGRFVHAEAGRLRTIGAKGYSYEQMQSLRHVHPFRRKTVGRTVLL